MWNPHSNDQKQLPPQTVKTLDKREKQIKMIPSPEIIKEYNRHIGGSYFLNFLFPYKSIQSPVLSRPSVDPLSNFKRQKPKVSFAPSKLTD